MKITKVELIRMFDKVAELFLANVDQLSAIDSKFGDGDHGVTIGKIAHLIEEANNQYNSSEWTIKEYFEYLGNKITNVNGGSAGPLYGTYLGGYGEILEDEVELDEEGFNKIIASGIEEIGYISNAKVGDKTMMDSIIPASEAIANCNGTLEEILEAGSKGADAGAENSKNFVSKFGRARMYKEQTIGTEDAGACSAALIFNGLYLGYINK